MKSGRVKANTVANILRYKNTTKSIQDHVEPEDKRRLSELTPKSKHNKTLPLQRNEKNTIYINESGLDSLILRSELESARFFKRWVTKEVLPSIRKTGRYNYDDMNHKYNDSLTFKIENELDLHIKLVSFLKKRYRYYGEDITSFPFIKYRYPYCGENINLFPFTQISVSILWRRYDSSF